MRTMKGGQPKGQPLNLNFTTTTKPKPAVTDTPVLDKAIDSVNTFDKARALGGKAYESIAGFVKEWGANNAAEQQANPGVVTPIKQGVRLGTTLVQETAAGGLMLVKSLNKLMGIPEGKRTPEQQDALEQIVFGRPVSTLQDAYVNPTLQYADQQGSGAIERSALGVGALAGGLFFENPITGKLKKPAKEIIDILADTTDTATIRTLFDIRTSNKKVNDIIGLIAKESDTAKVEALTTDLRRTVRASEIAKNYETPDDLISGQRRVFRGESTGSKNQPDFGNARYVSADENYAKSFGPVRTGYVPENVNVIAAERPIEPSITDVIKSSVSQEVKDQVDRMLVERPTATFREVWKVASNYGENGDTVNRALERAGYDGIEYLAARREGQNTISNIALFDDANVIDEDTLRGSFDAAKEEAARPKPEPLDLPQYEQAFKAQDSIITSIREFVDDSLVRLKAVVNDPTVKITDESNPYVKEELFHGRVDTLLQDGRAYYEDIVNQVNVIAAKYGLNAKELDDYVNDYFIARHAPERNAKLGDNAAGITTADANAFLKEAATKPYYQDLQAVAAKFDEFNGKTLEVLQNTGVITRELFDQLKTQYKHYAPLNRVMDGDTDLEQRLTGKVMDVRGSGIRSAKGSDREVRDVLGNATANYTDAVKRGEKNIVLNSLYKLVEDNPDLDLFKIRKPRAIGETFVQKDGTRRPLLEQLNEPNIIALRKDGKPVFIEVKDAQLAQAIQGINIDNIPRVLRFAQAVGRILSGLYTRFNVEFAFANKVRDIQEATVYLSAQKDLSASSVVRAATRNTETMKAVTDWHLGRDSEGAKLYDQMRHDGGITGGLSMTTRGDIELDINKYRKLSRSGTRKGFDKLIRSIDAWNTIFEDSTRLAAYKTALEQGLSRERAASLAKNASINFNRRGAAGPVVNALYIFANASIQGSVKLMTAMKNPKVAATVTTAVGTAVFSLHEWNDSVDPDWRDKVTEWDRMNGLPVVMPSTEGTFRYFTIPISWGLKPLNVLMNEAADLAHGRASDTAKSLERIGAAILNAYNPVGGTDALSAAVPTILDPFVDIGRNKSWTGSPIYPTMSKYTPDSFRYFDMLKDSASGRLAIDISKGLSGMGVEITPATFKYLFEQYTGGPGKTATKLIDTFKAIASEEDDIELDQVPFLSRFYRERTGEEIGAGGQLYQDAKKKLEGQARESAILSEQAEEAWSQLKDLDDAEYADRWNQLVAEDRDLAKKVKEVATDEAKGLTYSDRLVQQMGVSNGVRAQFIADQMRAAKTDEEYEAIWNDYVKKKLITKEVAKQITGYLSE